MTTIQPIHTTAAMRTPWQIQAMRPRRSDGCGVSEPECVMACDMAWSPHSRVRTKHAAASCCASHDLRVVVGHLGRCLEDVGERQEKQRKDQVQQILRQYQR